MLDRQLHIDIGQNPRIVDGQRQVGPARPTNRLGRAALLILTEAQLGWGYRSARTRRRPHRFPNCADPIAEGDRAHEPAVGVARRLRAKLSNRLPCRALLTSLNEEGSRLRTASAPAELDTCGITGRRGETGWCFRRISGNNRQIETLLCD